MQPSACLNTLDFVSIFPLSCTFPKGYRFFSYFFTFYEEHETMQKVYISSTYKDFKEYRSTLISLFQKELRGEFELSEIMEHMYDDGSSSTYVEECREAVKACDIYFIILGNSVGSYPPGETRTYTELEYLTAVEEDKIMYRLQLDPIDPKSVDDPKKHKALRESFEGKHVHYFKDETQLESIFLKCLMKHMKKVNTANPYKGMVPYEIEDGPYFFGRHHEIEELLKLILTSPYKRAFAITGSSGIGKSSFVKAGVVYRMLNDPMMGYSEYIPLVFQPGSQPLTDLKYHLHRHAGIFGNDLSGKDFEGKKIILCVDQLEQLITHCHTEAQCIERENFIEAMQDLATHPGLDLVILFTYRSDQEAELKKFPFLKEHTVDYRLSSFDHKGGSANWEQEMTEMITAPAEKHEVSLETDLVKRLLNDLESLDGCLPFLQYSLHKLWDPKVIKDHQISHAEFLTLSEGKGIPRLILKHADAAYSRITDKGTDALKVAVLKSMLLNLVEVNEDERDIRRTLPKRELFERLNVYDPTLVEEIFEELVNGNTRLLLVVDRGTVESEEGTKAAEAGVTLIHDGLVRRWDKLTVWIQDRREDLSLQKRLRRDSGEYFEDNGSLLRGKRLREALDWKKSNRDFWDESINAYIRKSRNGFIIRNSIPIMAVIAATLFKLMVFDPVIQKNLFLRDVVSSQPQNLRNYLESGGTLDKPQRINLNRGTFSELNGSMSFDMGIPLTRNFKYFDKIEELAVSNRPDAVSFSEIVEEFREIEVLGNLENNLKNLTLKKLNKLTALDGIASLKSIEELHLMDNFRLAMNDSLVLPPSLKLLEIFDNDGLIRIPELKNLDSLRSVRLIGNDALFRIGDLESQSLQSLLISGNSKLELVNELAALGNLGFLDINYNDNLERIDGLGKLNGLRELHIHNNPVLTPVGSLYGLDSLHTLRLGIPDMTRLPALPGGLRRLILSGNRELQAADLSGQRQLEYLELSNNFRLRSIPDLSRMDRLREVKLSNLFYLDGLASLSKATSIESLELSYLPEFLNESLPNIAGLPRLHSLKIQGDFDYNFDQETNSRKYPALKRLEFFGNESRSRFPAFTGLGLDSLILRKNPSVVYFGALDLDSLRYLEIRDNDLLRELPRPEGLPRIRELVLSGNKSIRNYGNICDMPSLEYLTLSGERSSNLEDLDFLNDLSSLKGLVVSDNPGLHYIQGISSCPNLESLTVSNNSAITEFPNLSNFSGLAQLALYGNSQLVWDPEMLATMNWSQWERLERLELDVETFTTLFLESGQLKETGYLKDLPNLKQLVIHTLPNTNLKPLRLIRVREANDDLNIEIRIAKK